MFGLAGTAALALLPWMPLVAGLSFDCNMAPSQPEDRRKDFSALRVGHWNVEWLFVENWAKKWTSQQQAVQHLQTVASWIKALDVDVLNLAEVEDCNVLRMLIDAIGDTSYKAYLVQGTDTATGQNVGLLTRVDPVVNLMRSVSSVAYPVSGNTCGSTGGPVTKHTPLDVRVACVAGTQGTHLLAFPSDVCRCLQREAQALVLQDVIRNLSATPLAQIIVLGDMNDYDGQVLDAASSTPISRVLAFLKNGIENVAQSVPEASRFTAYYLQPANLCLAPPLSCTSIDHMLISSSMQQRLQQALFVNSDYPPPCDQTQAISDHWPILADFALEEESQDALIGGLVGGMVALVILLVVIGAAIYRKWGRGSQTTIAGAGPDVPSVSSSVDEEARGEEEASANDLL